MTKRALSLFLMVCAIAFPQLTPDQKVAEFNHLIALFNKQYGPREWKESAFRIDVRNNARWIDQIRATRTDLEFFDVMQAWVAQLDDAHDAFQNPSNFVASLNFWVDIYDGKLLVDEINQQRIPTAEYPIAIGYELVSVDGEPATAILDRMLRYSIAANPRSTRRLAAELITIRPQTLIASAPSVPDTSTVIFRRFDGKLETYSMRWTRTGVPMVNVGKFPEVRTARAERPALPLLDFGSADAQMKISDALVNYSLPAVKFVRGFGARTPVFALPGTFQQRLGRTTTDPFFTGSYQADGMRIGFIRIPSFAPQDLNGAVNAFAREIAWMQENTDGLVVDIMRNPGGNSGYANVLLSFLIHYRWESPGMQIRATSSWIRDISSALESLRAQGAPPSYLAFYQRTVEKLQAANETGSLAEVIPWDINPDFNREPARDGRGSVLAYNRPIMLLTDEMSASASDGFAIAIQDNSRGPVFGWRTMGAGGNVIGTFAGTLSGGSVSLTQSLLTRSFERFEEGGYPASLYVENVGVHPDIKVDYMTVENLFGNGKPYVDAFTTAMVEHIRKNR